MEAIDEVRKVVGLTPVARLVTEHRD
jgi:hypothetical protein